MLQSRVVWRCCLSDWPVLLHCVADELDEDAKQSIFRPTYTRADSPRLAPVAQSRYQYEMLSRAFSLTLCSLLFHLSAIAQTSRFQVVGYYAERHLPNPLTQNAPTAELR